MFARMFGSGSAKPKPKRDTTQDLNTSIQTLRGSINQLEKREGHLETKIAQCVAKAKQKSKNRDKKGALFELKKKKRLEAQLANIQGQKFNLETQIMALEDAHMNSQTLKAMQTSKNTMKAAVAASDLDKADELMDDLNEAMDQVQEMNEAMAQPLGQMLDDDELEAELAELEEMEADAVLTEMDAPASQKVGGMKDSAATYDLPSVPSSKVAAPAATEDEELAELEAMMG